MTRSINHITKTPVSIITHVEVVIQEIENPAEDIGSFKG